MEEKERYIIDRFDGDIFDTKKEYYPSNQTICEIINQQDKQIKELKKENKELEIKIDKCGTELVNAESLVSYLENENQQLKQQLAESERKLEEYKKCNCKECMTDYEKNLNQIIDKYLNENIKLKQQLHDLPKNIVEEIRIAIFEECREYFNAEDDGVIQYTEITPKKCNKILDTILKKYGGENESK